MALTSKIFPEWPLFINSIKNETKLNERQFSTNQEAVQKDVGRLFVVIKGWLHILRT